jgi:hypothetical protein
MKLLWRCIDWLGRIQSMANWVMWVWFISPSLLIVIGLIYKGLPWPAILLLALIALAAALTIWLAVLKLAHYRPQGKNDNDILTILHPGEGLIRTTGYSREGDDTKIFYRNYFLIGVQNNSPEHKTIKDIKLKFWLVDTPRDCKISDSTDTRVTLNSGDIEYFNIGYIDSLNKFYMIKAFKKLPHKEFDVAYHNAGFGFLKLGNGEPESTISIQLDQLDLAGKSWGRFQFSADDIPPQFFKIDIYKDDNNGVRLECSPN